MTIACSRLRYKYKTYGECNLVLRTIAVFSLDKKSRPNIQHGISNDQGMEGEEVYPIVREYKT